METIRFTHEYEFESRDTNQNIINKIEPFLSLDANSLIKPCSAQMFNIF